MTHTMKKIKFTGLGLICSLFATTAFANGGGVVVILINSVAHTYAVSRDRSDKDTAEAEALSACGSTCAKMDVGTLDTAVSGFVANYPNGDVANYYVAYTTNGWAAVSVNHGTNIVGISAPSANADQSTAEYSAYNDCIAKSTQANVAQQCYTYRSTASFTNAPDQDGVRPQAAVPAPTAAPSTATTSN